MLALGCRTPLAVEQFSELPGFTPYEQYVIRVNRKLAIMSEGTGTLNNGARVYYIAYLSREEIPDTAPPPEAGGRPPFKDPLWGEMQAVWRNWRMKLDAKEYAVVILDARVFPGTPGSRTRRAIFASDGTHWYWDQITSVVFEAP